MNKKARWLIILCRLCTLFEAHVWARDDAVWPQVYLYFNIHVECNIYFVLVFAEVASFVP